MRVKDIQQLADSKKGKKITVFNPTTEDFKWKFDRKEYVIPKGEAVKFDYAIGTHLGKHLVDRILTEKEISTRPSKKRSVWEKKVLI